VIQDKIEQVGYKAKTISIKHLPEIQEEVAKLVRQGMISEQLHSTWHFYKQTNKNLPEAKTIIIVAIPQTITSLSFNWRGIVHHAEIAPNYLIKADESKVEEILKSVLKPSGCRIAKAHLALKTLAVRSGLAEYGRNNISYIPGMGSFYRLMAFYTDYSCQEDSWHEAKVMKACENCVLCLDACPTGSISANRFLIYANKCLSFLNQMDPDFPYWVQHQLDWQNAFVGCMGCQFVCPLNKPFKNKISEGAHFSEEETILILNKTPWEKLSLDTRQKLDDLQTVFPLLERNLSALIEKHKKSTKL
jgi:epoxyqueuosine reductase